VIVGYQENKSEIFREKDKNNTDFYAFADCGLRCFQFCRDT